MGTVAELGGGIRTRRQRDRPGIAGGDGAGECGPGAGSGRRQAIGTGAGAGQSEGAGSGSDGNAGAAGDRRKAGKLGRLAKRIVVAFVDVGGQSGGDQVQRGAVAGDEVGRLYRVGGDLRAHGDGPDLAGCRRAGQGDVALPCRADGVVGRNRQHRRRRGDAVVRDRQLGAADEGRVTRLGFDQGAQAGGDVGERHTRDHGEVPGQPGK